MSVTLKKKLWAKRLELRGKKINKNLQFEEYND